MDGILYGKHLRLYRFLTKTNFNHIAHLHIIGGALRFIVYEHSAGIAGIIRNRTAFNESRYLQILVKSHEILVNLILQSLTSLELRALCSSDLHGLASSRVSALSCRSLSNLEGTKANQLYSVALCKSLGNCIENCLYSCVSVLLGKDLRSLLQLLLIPSYSL